jgi:cAMP-specific phosphodiesterase 4/calcium/calmodulin-dependent 3',5'-cyclic nucleotide phosphodiesterase
MACLFAAAVHDFEHMGVSNEFLIRTRDQRAMTYNDQHVNENHHVAEAFAVLQKPECNFLECLTSVDFRRFRSLVIELVLGTDMANNGKILKAFNDTFGIAADACAAAKAKPVSAKDSVVLLQFALKCADLGHLALSWNVHHEWVCRLEEEFFAQGDREKALGWETSFLMDREKPGCTETQAGFFDFVVFPLFRSLVAVAPATQPMLDGVTANYEAWKRQDSMMSSKIMDELKTSPDTSQHNNGKRSGRSRQRGAKFWAKVRAKTPSPES